MRITIFFICFLSSFISFSDEVYFNMDKGFYLSGQTLQYDVTLINNDGDIYAINKVFQLNLVKPDGTVISQQLLKTRKGLADGTVFLPDTLSTSYYLVELLEYSSGKAIFSVFVPVFNPKSADAGAELSISEKPNGQSKSDSIVYDLQNARSLLMSNNDFELLPAAKFSTLREEQDLVFDIGGKMSRNVMKWYVTINSNYFSSLEEKGDSRRYPSFFKSEDPYLSLNTSEDYLSVSGTITDKNGDPYKQLLITLVINPENPIIKSSFSGNQGEFKFSNIDFNGSKRLSFNFSYDFKGNKPVINLDDKYIQTVFNGVNDELVPAVTDEVHAALKTDSLYSIYKKEFQVNELILRESKAQFDQNKIATIKPDQEYVLSDFRKFDDTYSLFKELITAVSFRKNDESEREFRMFSAAANTNFPGPPAFLIDGYLISDYNFILNLEASFFESIVIVSDPTKLFKYGPVASNGLIVISTKKRLIDNFENAYNVTSEGYADSESLNINLPVLSSNTNLPLLINDLEYMTLSNEKRRKSILIPTIVPDNYRDLVVIITALTKNAQAITYEFPLEELMKK